MNSLRTFIAVPIKVENHFLHARGELMKSLASERITWVEPERYHVTISFLGDTTVGMVEKIRFSMREMPYRQSTTDVKLGDLGSFGPMKRPRVAWVGFEDSSFFEALKEEVDAALTSCGILSSEQAFRAHLTLGRVRGLKDLKGYYRTIDSMKGSFSGKVLADRLVYYRSELGSKGPTYTPLEEVLFSGQAL